MEKNRIEELQTIKERVKEDKARRLKENNFSVARFVGEGNPDNQIKHGLEKQGEDPKHPIPDGDQV